MVKRSAQTRAKTGAQAVAQTCVKLGAHVVGMTPQALRR